MLRHLINLAISLKDGNKEFALFHYENGDWKAEIGNTSQHVNLGENSGEFSTELFKTPERAVENLIDQLILHLRQKGGAV